MKNLKLHVLSEIWYEATHQVGMAINGSGGIRMMVSTEINNPIIIKTDPIWQAINRKVRGAIDETH